MSWNYRIILHDLDPVPERHWAALHEVHYGLPNDPATPALGWGKEPATFQCFPDEGAEGIIGALERALRSLRDPEFAVIIKESEWELHKRPGKVG